LSVDPFAGVQLRPISLHHYLYANASPVVFTDPTGKWNISEFATAQSIQSSVLWGAGTNAAMSFAGGMYNYSLGRGRLTFGDVLLATARDAAIGGVLGLLSGFLFAKHAIVVAERALLMEALETGVVLGTKQAVETVVRHELRKAAVAWWFASAGVGAATKSPEDAAWDAISGLIDIEKLIDVIVKG
jgi:hypothetical protein